MDNEPPISKHEFYDRFYQRIPSNQHTAAHGWLHSGHDAVDRIPQRKGIKMIPTNGRLQFWGIVAREKKSGRRMLFYFIICWLIGFFFFLLLFGVLQGVFAGLFNFFVVLYSLGGLAVGVLFDGAGRGLGHLGATFRYLLVLAAGGSSGWWVA